MISFLEWKKIVPESLERAKKVDLITLPKGVSGTNCGNCKYVDNGYCTHKEVLMTVNKHMCCAKWDHEAVIRDW